MSASNNLGPQFGPSGTHLGFTDPATWASRHAIEHDAIKQTQFLGQVGAAKAHVEKAKQARLSGDRPRAARELKSARNEGSIAVGWAKKNRGPLPPMR